MASSAPPDPGAAVAWPSESEVDQPSEAGPPAWGQVVRRVVPGLIVAVLVGWLVAPAIGLVVAAVATALGLAAARFESIGRGFDRVVAWISLRVGQVLTVLVLGTVFLVVFMPVGLLRRLSGGDPLRLAATTSRSTWAPRTGWLGRRLPDRSYASERDLSARGSRGRIVTAVGVAGLLIVADLALGTVVLQPPVDAARTGVAGGGPEAIPALADEPYVTTLFTEIFSAESGQYDPLLGWRLADFQGDHLNIADGERVSLPPARVADDPVVVWFFGGSTMYGFGQRDDHTIASEVVRLAGSDGIAVEAHNFGTPAYDNWQETQLFARLLTQRPAPDVAVFYDGYNDVSQQLIDGPHTEPSHALARSRQLAIERPEETVGADDVRAWWADHSAVTNLIRRVQRRFDGGNEPTVQLTQADTRVPEDLDVDAVVASTETLLARGRTLAEALGESFDVEVAFWWQPTLYTRQPDPGEAEFFEQAENRTEAWFPISERLAAGLPDGVVDLSDSLDDVAGPVYWDTVHTNETGAAVIAEAGYRSLRDLLISQSGQSG